jgi:hypothetical protein
MRGDVMALAETIDVAGLGERRWAEWWADRSGDVVLGAALLAVFDAWDGDDSMVSHSVHEQFIALDRRLMAYEDWCADLGIEPARRPVQLRVVDGQGDELDPVLCGDCHGSGIVTDDDGSLSGLVGTLVDCGCAGGPCMGPGVLEVCRTMLGRPLTEGERSVAMMAEYLAQCRARGVASAWCLTCGTYVAESLDACTCPTGPT